MAEPILSELVDLVVEMMGKRYNKGDIKRVIYEVNDGHIKTSNVERIFQLARVKIRQTIDLDMEEHLSESIEFYRSIIRDDTVPVQTRVDAQEKLNNMLGVGAKWSINKDNNEKSAKKTIKAIEKMKGATNAQAKPESERSQEADAAS